MDAVAILGTLTRAYPLTYFAQEFIWDRCFQCNLDWLGRNPGIVVVAPLGFALQSTTNLASPTVWSIVYPASVIVNSQNEVTNLIAGTRKLYRLM